MYVITDDHGSYIRKDGYSNKYVPVRNKALAEKFSQRVKAANVLKNGVAKNIRSQYKVVEIEEDSTPVKKPPKEKPKKKDEIAKSIASEKCEEEQTDKWVSGTEQLKEFIVDAECRKEELINQLSEADKEITDIHHYIELGTFNAYQGWLAFSMLKQKLTKRRKIKNELRVINELGACKITSDMMADINNAINQLENRKYSPRVLTQLFD